MGIKRGPDIVRDGLVLYLDAANPKSYPGSGTTWNDLSPNGNTGTLVNGVGYNADNNGSLVFDGVDDYITVNRIELSSMFTISTWLINPDIGGGSGGGDYNMYMGSRSTRDFLSPRNDTEYILAIGGDATRLTWTIDLYSNQIKQFLITRDSNNSIELFINGVSQGSFINNQLLTIDEIGTAYNSNYVFDGSLNEPKIYNKTLTPQEIQQNYNATKSRYGL